VGEVKGAFHSQSAALKERSCGPLGVPLQGLKGEANGRQLLMSWSSAPYWSLLLPQAKRS